MANPARNVWVTETALTTALNTSYMAEQISLFGIGVGAAFLLVGLVLGRSALAGGRPGAVAAGRCAGIARLAARAQAAVGGATPARSARATMFSRT